MTWSISIILGLLWVLAMMSARTFGGYVHLLLAAAVIAVIYQVVKTRRENSFKKGV